MLMGIPLFLLFAVYGVFNTYLPILLAGLGYTPSMIGILQGLFEVSGFLFPVFVSSRVDRTGRYGQAMIAMAILMTVVLPPLVLFRNFYVTALVLALFSIGFKGAVPVSDALVSRILGDDRNGYGRVRVLGSIGFVCMALLLQFAPLVNPDSPASIALWIGIVNIGFALSVAVIPGLLRVWPAHAAEPAAPKGDVSLDSPVQSAPEGIIVGNTGKIPSPKPDSRLVRYRQTLVTFGKSYWIGIALIFLGFLGMVPSQRFFSLYVREALHLESYAGLWALSAAAEVPFMFLSGWFIKRFGTERLLFASLAAIALRNMIYALVPTFPGAVAGQLLHSICFGLFHPAAIVFVMERAPKRFMAVAMTIYTSVAVGLSAALGNVAGGFIIENLGYTALFSSFSVFPAAGMIAFFFFRRRLYRRD